MPGSFILAFALLASQSAQGARINTKARAKPRLDAASEQDAYVNDVSGLSAAPKHWAKYAAQGKDLEEFAKNADLNEHRHWEFALLEEDAAAAENSTSELTGYSERKTFCPLHWRDRVARQGKWVGGGSFGKVYLAQVTCDPANAVTMAFKVQKSTDFVMDEIKMQESFDHPNIIKAVDHYKGPKRGQITMLMEAAGGGDFEKLPNTLSREYDPALIEQLFYESALATQYAHETGVMHSDIKPENIMLSARCTSSRQCHAKLADFGVSCYLNRRGSCDGMAGTPYFMSPEMCVNGRRSPSDDVWALGVTLYAVIYGNYPKAITNINARSTELLLRGIGQLMRQKYMYRARHSSLLEHALEGMLVADPRSRMSLNDVAALLKTGSWAASYSSMHGFTATPSCWHTCESKGCYSKKPMKPCLVDDSGTPTCGADEADDVENEADARLIEIVINRGYRTKCGFYMDEVRQTVRKLTSGAPAERAGLRVGDVVQTIQHKAWSSLPKARIHEIIKTYPRVVLEVYRN